MGTRMRMRGCQASHQWLSRTIREGTDDVELEEEAEVSGQCVNDLPLAVALSARIVSRERML